MAKLKIRLSDEEAHHLGLPLNKREKNRPKAQYRITEKQLEEINYIRSLPKEREFVETLRKFGKNGELISRVEKLEHEALEVPENFEIIKITNTPYTSGQFIQYAPKKEKEATVNEIDFEAIIKKYIKPFKVNPIVLNRSSFVDRLVYTDVHIGMNTNENGYSLYGGKWDEEEILERLETMISWVLHKKDSDVLLIDELGDFMDGWDGETVRKGHSLPQNMDNETAYDVGLHFKIRLIDALIPHYKKIICHNICNDNHSGSFGYTVNSAFKKFIELRYDNVSVVNVRKFIDHYRYGNIVPILTHGKDGKHLKFGFKPILDDKQIKKIKNYIDEHCLLIKDVRIIFSKGDSHQDLMDKTTSDAFDYYNYPAFSPSSEWVQTNFQKGKSGFYFYNIREDGSESVHPYYFKWKTNREETTVDFNKLVS